MVAFAKSAFADLVVAGKLSTSPTFLALKLIAFVLVVLTLVSCSSREPTNFGSLGRDEQEFDTKAAKSLMAGEALSAASKGGKRAPASEPLELIALKDSGTAAIYRTGEVAYIANAQTTPRVAFSSGETITSGAVALETGLVALASTKTVTIYAPNQNAGYNPAFTWSTLKTRVSSMDFAPDARSLLLGGADGMVYRWRFADAAEPGRHIAPDSIFEKYYGHPTITSRVKFHPFGRVFFSSDWSGVVLAWLRYDADQFEGEYDKNLINGSVFANGSDRMRLPRGDTDQIEALSVSLDGKALLVATQAGNLELWKTRGLKREAAILGHRGLIYDAVVSAKGERIISSGRDGKLKLFVVLKTPEVTGATVLWSLQDTETVEGLDIRRIACNAVGACVGADSHGKISLLPLSLKE